MTDAIDIVGERIAYWAGQNNPKDGKPTFDRSWSKLKITDTSDLQYGEPIPKGITPTAVYESEWDNSGSVQDSQSITVDETTTNTFTWSLKEGLTIKTKFKAKIPLVGEAENEVDLNFEATQTTTKTKSRRWQYSGTVPVPPGKKVHVSFMVNQAKFEVPFKALQTVRGIVWIKFENGKWWKGDVETMISKLNWGPYVFIAAIEGTFTGIQGESFKVDIKEYSLSDDTNFRADTIDAGFLRDGKLVNAPTELLKLTERE